MANKIEAVGSALVVAGLILGVEEGVQGSLTYKEIKQLESQTVSAPENAAEVEFSRKYVTVYESTTRDMGMKGEVEKIPTLFDNKLIAKAYIETNEDDARQQAWNISRTNRMLQAAGDQFRRAAVMVGGIFLVIVGLILGDQPKRNKTSSANGQNGRALEVNTTA